MDAYNKLKTKSDLFIINVVKQKDNYPVEKVEAAQRLFEERGLTMEQSDAILGQRKEAISQIKEMMFEGKSIIDIEYNLKSMNLPVSEVNKLIYSTHKGLEIELLEEHSSRNKYYFYLIFWIIGFSIFLVVFLSRFFGDGVLMGNLLLAIPFLYFRFKHLPKLHRLRTANQIHGYDKAMR